MCLLGHISESFSTDPSQKENYGNGFPGGNSYLLVEFLVLHILTNTWYYQISPHAPYCEMAVLLFEFAFSWLLAILIISFHMFTGPLVSSVTSQCFSFLPAFFFFLNEFSSSLCLGFLFCSWRSLLYRSSRSLLWPSLPVFSHVVCARDFFIKFSSPSS